MKHIETIELDTAAASIELSSIPQDYDDLVLLVTVRADRANDLEDVLGLRFNNSQTLPTTVSLYGDGSTVTTRTDTNGRSDIVPAIDATANTFSNSSIYINKYRISGTKSFSVDGTSENNGSLGYTSFLAGLWSDPAAITTITMFSIFGNGFLAGSAVSLYGIKAGGDGTVTTA